MVAQMIDLDEDSVMSLRPILTSMTVVIYDGAWVDCKNDWARGGIEWRIEVVLLTEFVTS